MSSAAAATTAADPPIKEKRLPFEAPIAEKEARLLELEALAAQHKDEPGGAGLADLVRAQRRDLLALKRSIFSELTPWQTVQVARHDQRPQTRDYIALIFDRFLELHGDRAIGDDKAIVSGFAHLDDTKVMVIGQQKGKTLHERMACRFGCPHPEGYRKALLKMRLAEKFGLPIITFIDTLGAYPGISAEERGQALVIAENLFGMSQLRTPIITVVIGEGGSGGALGIGVADRVAMLEHSYYSVISPEGCASILWKGAEHAERAAAALKFTSKDLLRFGVIDGIVPEPLGGAHRDHREAAANLKSFLIQSLREIGSIPRDELPQRRYEKFRKMGVFTESALAGPEGEQAAELPGVPAAESA